MRPGQRRGADRLHRHGPLPLRRPRDRPGGQRPRGRARRPGLARDLPHDRLGRHRRRQPARGRRDARRLQGRGLGQRQRLRLRAGPGRGPAGRRQLRLRRLLPPGRSVRVGLRSPSPLPERTHAHVHPRPRRRGTAGHRAGRLRRDFTVTGGKLDWTMANQFAGGGDAARTWLGYATNTAPVGGPASGGQGRADGAGDDDRPDRRRGDGHRRRLAARRSTSSSRSATRSRPRAGRTRDEGVGSVELEGTFTLHRRTASRSRSSNPLVTLNGLTGTLRGQRLGDRPRRRDGAVRPLEDPVHARPLQRRRSRCARTARARSHGIVPVSTADTALAGFPAPRAASGR